MSQTVANRFHPKQWTILTWLAILLWAWRPLFLNYPPSVVYLEDPVTGEFSVPRHYKSLSELDFPVGWPLYYVKPSYLTAPASPIPVGTPLPPPAPASVHPVAMVANFVLVAIAISALVYFLQRTAPRFSLLVLFGVVTAVPMYFAVGRLVARLVGYDAAWWYTIAVYFSPIPAGLAVRFSIFPRLKWPHFRSMEKFGRRSPGEFENADDVIAAASKLEMRGDWTASIDLYRRAAERWPEHSEYAQRCIERVIEKQSLAHT